MTDTIRDLLISLASHVAYMQGQLEARHELDDPEDYYWYRESVLLRQKVTDALADEPAVPQPPAEGEVAWLREIAQLWEPDAPRAKQLFHAADLLQRLSPPQPVAVSERLPGPEDCIDEGWAWFFSSRVGWRQAVFPVSTAYTHWLPAHALPIPQQQKNAND